MKKITLKLLFISMFVCPIILNSCKKDQKSIDESPALQLNEQDKNALKVTFAKALAIAIEKEPLVRKFIKEESLKQFDNDYDVLFEMVRGTKLDNNETFYDKVVKYASSKNDIDKAIEQLPTLTIMVPEVPNFSADSWNLDSEKPAVAVSPDAKVYKNVEMYYANGRITKVPYGSIPAFPVVVVKENERVSVSGHARAANKSATANIASAEAVSVSDNQTFLVSNNRSFKFNNEAFNGSRNNVMKQRTMYGKLSSVRAERPRPDVNVVDPSRFDQTVIDAYNLQLDWQRDYIYYGLNPATGVKSGKFNNNYQEYIVSIRMKDNNIGQISDQEEDPRHNDVGYYYPNIPPGREGVRPSLQPPVYPWTDGAFEINISVLINSKHGAGTTVSKVISAKPSDLYTPTYQKDRGTGIVSFRSLLTKEFFVNEPIAPWDLENYGSVWKFIVFEKDNSETEKKAYTYTTVFATNFNFEAGFGEKVKIGAKFGASTTDTKQNSYEIVTTRTSDQLGEGILEFGSPIIVRKEANGTYVPNTVSTGSMLITVEPRRYRN